MIHRGVSEIDLPEPCTNGPTLSYARPTAAATQDPTPTERENQRVPQGQTTHDNELHLSTSRVKSACGRSSVKGALFSSFSFRIAGLKALR